MKPYVESPDISGLWVLYLVKNTESWCGDTRVKGVTVGFKVSVSSIEVGTHIREGWRGSSVTRLCGVSSYKVEMRRERVYTVDPSEIEVLAVLWLESPWRLRWTVNIRGSGNYPWERLEYKRWKKRNLKSYLRMMNSITMLPN